MRSRLIIQVLSLAVIVAVGMIWLRSRAAAIELEACLSALAGARSATVRALEQERDRLRVALAEADRRQLADAAAVPPAPVPPAESLPAGPSLALGEWSSSREWRNEGQQTAKGTVATLLWAATGGDVAALTPLIAYDEAGRARAQELFDSMPLTARHSFPTPEALVAGLTIAAVPNSAVQLSWYHERDPDHATVGLLLSAPEQTPETDLHVLPSRENTPPMLSARQSIQFTFLSLERSAQGWRVVIPAAAVERLARYKIPANQGGLN